MTMETPETISWTECYMGFASNAAKNGKDLTQVDVLLSVSFGKDSTE